jgi:hypothetical protein
MVERHCKACDHFFDIGHSLGVCRRYPTYQNRGPNELCGEFKPVHFADPIPEMVELPVFDMEEKPKRKGRPPKKTFDMDGAVI